MQKRQRNTLSAYFTLSRFFERNEADIIEAMEKFPEYLIEYNAKLDQIEKDEWRASENKTGYTLQRKVYKLDLASIAFIVGNAYVSYYNSIDDDSKDGLFDRPLSELETMTEAGLCLFCDFLIERCTPPIAGMAVYKANAATIDLFKAALSTYKKFLNSSLEQIHEPVRYGKRVTKDFAAMADFLKFPMDRAFKSLRISHPILYSGYFQNRKRVDHAATHGKPTKTITVPPKSFLAGLEIDYVGNRSFRIVNKSGEVIFWSLSSKATEFTNTMRNLGPNSASHVRSSTLGPSGHILLFQNTTDKPMEIDIWVVE